MRLESKEIGHGIAVERYTATNGKKVVLLVSTAGDAECYYNVLDMSGNLSAIIYDRAAAMKIAESRVM